MRNGRRNGRRLVCLGMSAGDRRLRRFPERAPPVARTASDNRPVLKTATANAGPGDACHMLFLLCSVYFALLWFARAGWPFVTLPWGRMRGRPRTQPPS